MFRRGGSIAGRGGHSGGGNRSDEERNGRKRRPSDPARARCAASDTARKCGARKYTNYGLPAPPAFARREVVEYDRRMEFAAAAGRSRYAHGSSSGAGSSSMVAQLPPPKREGEEQDRPPRRGILPGDWAKPEDLPWITEEVIERSKQQHQEQEARRRMEEELDERRLQAAIEESLHPVIELSSDSDIDFDFDSD